MTLRSPGYIICFLILGLALSACGGTSAATVPPADTAVAATETAAPPTNTPVPATETPPPTDTPESESVIDLGMALAGGDPLLGELSALDYRCFGCHDNAAYAGENGPEFSATEDLPPIMERGEMRIADPAYEGSATTGREYVIESILSPAAYTVPGDWPKPMPETFHEDMTDEELAGLIAWMETFSEADDSPTDALPTSTPEAQAALEPGDPGRGQEIFETGGGVIRTKCINCHTLDGSEATGRSAGPTMLGIAAAAGERVPGMTAEEYLLQSILDPSAYVVEGYEDKMEKSYQWLLSEEDQAALVAFLLALEEPSSAAPETPAETAEPTT